MIPFSNTNRGLIKMVILIIIVLLLLAYFGFNLRNIVGSPTFQDNWAFIRDAAVSLWNSFLKVPLTYFWNNIFVPLIWNPGLHNLEQMSQGQMNDIQKAATSTL
jgi:hypothetical protein